MKANEIMEEDTPQYVWDSDRFLELRNQFLDNKNEVTAANILTRLCSIDQESVDPSAWLDAKDLIVLLLENIPVSSLLGAHQVLILAAVNHGSPNVVYTLARFFKSKQEALHFLNSSSVAVAIALARRINETECAEEVAHVLASIAANPQILNELQDQLSNNSDSEHRFKIYEVVLSAFQNGFYKPELRALLAPVLQELDGHDVLAHLTALDFLSSIAISGNQAVLVLAEIGATRKVYSMLEHAKDAPDGGFLYPGCIKFFGYLCKSYTDGLSQYSYFLKAVFDMVRHFDLLDASQRVLAFDTLGHLGHSKASKLKLMQLQGSEEVQFALAAFGAAIGSGPVELRCRHLDALAMLFEQGDAEMLKSWYGWLGEPFSKLVFDMVQKPFPEIRIAVFGLFNNLMEYEFHISRMLNVGGFIEWLLDSTTETDWECVQAKNALVKKLIDSGSNSINAPLLLKLKGYFVAPRRENIPQIDMVNL